MTSSDTIKEESLNDYQLNLKLDAIFINVFISQARWNLIAHLYMPEAFLWGARKHGLQITDYKSNELGILLKSAHNKCY